MKINYAQLLAYLFLFAIGVFITQYWWKPNHSVDVSYGEIKIVPKETSGWNVTYLQSGEGYPVVILPGLGRTFSDFEGLALTLNQAGYETIIMNLATAGDSERSIDGLAATLAGMVDYTVKDKSYCLIGHDFGSDVIRQFVPKQTNSQIKAAIFISPSGDSIGEYHVKKRRLLYNKWQPPHRRLNAMKELYFYKDSLVPENWKKDWRGLNAASQAKAFDNLDREIWSDDNQIPVLMLHGQNDPVHSAEEALKSMRDQNIINIDVKIAPKTSRAFIPEQQTLLASETIEYLNKYCRP